MIAWRDRSSRRSRLAVLAAAWSGALALGVIGYLQLEGAWPRAVDLFVCAPLMAPFALPIAFAGTFGFRPGPGALLPLTTAYWAVLMVAHRRAFTTRDVPWRLAVAVLVLASGGHWLVNARGLLLS